MCTCPCLAIPDFSAPFTVECNASKLGIGAMLMQNGQPIAFESRKLSNAEQSFSVYDKEMLAIMHALERFKQYLVCEPFTIWSDHNNPKYFLNQTDLSEKQQRWVSNLQSFDFEIQYVKQKKNIAIDALSRNPSFYSLSSIVAKWNKDVMDEYAQDDFASRVLSGALKNKRYVVREGLILKRNQVFLTPTSKVKKVLHALHNTPLAAHPGITKTYQAVRERFTWKGLKQDILKHIQECIQCQEKKEDHMKPGGLLQPLPIPHQKCKIEYP